MIKKVYSYINQYGNEYEMRCVNKPEDVNGYINDHLINSGKITVIERVYEMVSETSYEYDTTYKVNKKEN